MKRLRAALTLLLCAPAALLAAGPALAQLDLARAGITRLDNGLTVIVLEDNSLPVVSVQVLYKVGSRDETSGKTGLAHMLEHLAFRATENFPDGSATDAIYDAGGEWHGYTWIDQTTYFATAPASRLDLLLAIEADRMARVTFDPASIAAESGAVITEMHGYENDPASVLFDAAVAAAIQTHPYRASTIGLESDVAGLTAADAEGFYASHYAPGNAVLAIAGDVDPAAALALVQAHFASLPARELAAPTRAAEPPQQGERRTQLTGPVERQYLKLVYPAPAATSPDFAAFLLLQQLLAGGSGVNFNQNDWGTPADANAALAGIADDLTSWFIPTRDPYVFMISASIDADGVPDDLEAAIAARIQAWANADIAADDLASARAAVHEQLVFDLETTEDAAHQLAYFEGIGALDTLLGLPADLEAVTYADITRAARLYLDPRRRTVAWLVPGDRSAPLPSADPVPSAPRPASAPTAGPAPGPQLLRLPSGLPVILQQSPLSPTVALELLLAAPIEGSAGDYPGLGNIANSARAENFANLPQAARSALDAAIAPGTAQRSNDPAARLEQMIAQETQAGLQRQVAPIAAVMTGEIDPAAALSALDSAFGDLAPAPLRSEARQAQQTLADGPTLRREQIELPLAQAALGYVVPAPPPGTASGLAAQMLLYVLSHEYGGRLGDEAISARGLVYYIGSDYRTDGNAAWITLSIGVDPERIDETEAVLRSELARLASSPPSAEEIAAARQHILGRDISAAQSNTELAAHLLRSFVESGGLRSNAQLAADLAQVGVDDIAAAARAFDDGTILRVDVGPAPQGERK